MGKRADVGSGLAWEADGCAGDVVPAGAEDAEGWRAWTSADADAAERAAAMHALRTVGGMCLGACL